MALKKSLFADWQGVESQLRALWDAAPDDVPPVVICGEKYPNYKSSLERQLKIYGHRYDRAAASRRPVLAERIHALKKAIETAYEDPGTATVTDGSARWSCPNTKGGIRNMARRLRGSAFVKTLTNRPEA